MKNMRFSPLECIAVLVFMMLMSPLKAQTMHSGERSDDFTGIRRNMTPLGEALCSNNQISVGSKCVDVPVTEQKDGVRSWVSYFLEQKRGPVRINGDGTLDVVIDAEWSNLLGLAPSVHPFPGIPQANQPILTMVPWGCYPYAFNARPLFTNAAIMIGGPPYDWTYTKHNEYDCNNGDR